MFEANGTYAKNIPAAAREDIESIDSLLKALYESFSFSPNDRPNWNRLRSLFHPQAILIPARGSSQKTPLAMSLEQFMNGLMARMTMSNMKRRGMDQKEVGRKVHRYNNIAQAFSVYEARYADSPESNPTRGLNSIQLSFSNNRWYIMTIFWDDETEDAKISEALIGTFESEE